MGYSGNSLILSYQVEFKTADKAWDSNNKALETASGNSNSLTLRKLKPLTTYHVRVRAENGLGWGDFSELVQFTTEEEGEIVSDYHVSTTSQFRTLSWCRSSVARQAPLFAKPLAKSPSVYMADVRKSEI